MPDSATAPAMAGWARLELLGHRTMVGYVTEVDLCGTKMLKVDVPEGKYNRSFTQFYGAGAIFAITPISKDDVDVQLSPMYGRGHHVPGEYEKEDKYQEEDKGIPF
jgi:hypothetical protein